MKNLLIKLGFHLGDPYDWEPTLIRRAILWEQLHFKKKSNATCNARRRDDS